jgi:hypothetical protein
MTRYDPIRRLANVVSLPHVRDPCGSSSSSSLGHSRSARLTPSKTLDRLSNWSDKEDGARSGGCARLGCMKRALRRALRFHCATGMQGNRSLGARQLDGDGGWVLHGVRRLIRRHVEAGPVSTKHCHCDPFRPSWGRSHGYRCSRNSTEACHMVPGRSGFRRITCVHECPWSRGRRLQGRAVPRRKSAPRHRLAQIQCGFEWRFQRCHLVHSSTGRSGRHSLRRGG